MINNIKKDCLIIRKHLNVSQHQLAKMMNLSRPTIARIESGNIVDKKTMEAFYSFAYQNSLLLNEMRCFVLEDDKENNILLFHGSKSEIEGNIDLNHCHGFNDFGNGFYAGETYQQAGTWVSNEKNGSIYALYFENDVSLKHYEFSCDKEWMIAILFYRGLLEKYKDCVMIKDIIAKIQKCDYIIAPIADNMMYDILSQFANGVINDEQCRHALRANNLGKQYIFLTENAIFHLKIKEHFYLCNEEKTFLKNIKIENSFKEKQKVEISLIQYRKDGKYIDELFDIK